LTCFTTSGSCFRGSTKQHMRFISTTSFIARIAFLQSSCNTFILSAYKLEPQQQQTLPFQSSIPNTSILSSYSKLDDAESDKSNEESIDYETISKILRTTCEINRQLKLGTDGSRCKGGYSTEVAGGHRMKLPVLSLFHGKRRRPQRRENPRHGVEIWGPNLELYLRELLSTLECPSICISLALLYLDRACSEEIQRDVAPCPSLAPQTVHRLLLTAMILASKAVGQVNYEKAIEKFGMTEKELLAMEQWMSEAMGYEGLWFSRENLMNVSQKIFHASNWAHGWRNNVSAMVNENVIKKVRIINNRDEQKTEKEEVKERHEAFLNFYGENTSIWGKQDSAIPITCHSEDIEERNTSVWI